MRATRGILPPEATAAVGSFAEQACSHSVSKRSVWYCGDGSHSVRQRSSETHGGNAPQQHLHLRRLPLPSPLSRDALDFSRQVCLALPSLSAKLVDRGPGRVSRPALCCQPEFRGWMLSNFWSSASTDLLSGGRVPYRLATILRVNDDNDKCALQQGVCQVRNSADAEHIAESVAVLQVLRESQPSSRRELVRRQSWCVLHWSAMECPGCRAPRPADAGSWIFFRGKSGPIWCQVCIAGCQAVGHILAFSSVRIFVRRQNCI